MGDKKDNLKDLCINKKGEALFQIMDLREGDQKKCYMCRCTKTECTDQDEAEISTYHYLHPEKICPYLSEDDDDFFIFWGAFYLGCNYRNSDEKKE